MAILMEVLPRFLLEHVTFRDVGQNSVFDVYQMWIALGVEIKVADVLADLGLIWHANKLCVRT
eukprot:5996806-Amphidinium_carterae.1